MMSDEVAPKIGRRIAPKRTNRCIKSKISKNIMHIPCKAINITSVEKPVDNVDNFQELNLFNIQM